MELIKSLKDIGLSDKEARCYLALLPLNQATAYMVALRSGIKKPTAYVILESLVNKGFALKIPSQKKIKYMAKSPRECLAFVSERMKLAQEALPELMAIRNSISDKPKVYYFEDKEGLDLIDADILKLRSEIVSFTTPLFVTNENEKASKAYIKKRISAGTLARVIGQVSAEVQDLKKRDKTELRQTKMLPSELFSSEVELGICGNKVYVSNYKKKFGLIIEDKDISATLQKIFELVWSSEKIVE
jgi:HTH-type transcriptional regulator, sugar sensing transcriptional regulator